MLVIAGVTIVVVIASVWVATPARRQRVALADEDAKLKALINSSNLWVTQFEPASNEESAIWQNTASEVQALGVKPTERLTLAQIVLRRAEDADLVGAHLKFVPVDAATAAPARQVAGVTFNPASYTLSVSGSGSLGTLISFLEALPPAVQLASVSMTRDSDAGVKTALSLSVFEPVGGNAK
ncbi:MAG: hypothetical protein M3Z17_07695 [Gemmatimonadota bacterium]|nr:hypothetical protein [Gemmatimonadota bacterium]